MESTITVIPTGLDCSVCLELYVSPKLLQCGHTFCARCLENLLLTTSTTNKRISCPTCRRETILNPGIGIEGLTVNYSLQSIVDQYKCQAEGCRSPINNNACPHCQRQFCTNCLLNHVKLLADEIRHNAELLRKTTTSDLKKFEEIALEKIAKNVRQTTLQIEAHCQLELENFTTALEFNKARLIFEANRLGQEMLAKLMGTNLVPFFDWLQRCDQQPTSIENVTKLYQEMQSSKEIMQVVLNATQNDNSMIVSYEAKSVSSYTTELDGKGSVTMATADKYDCTYDIHGNNAVNQQYAECVSCFGEQSCYGICVNCAKLHHAGHQLIYHDADNKKSFICDCGRSKHRLPLCTAALTGTKHVRQAMYICYDCFDIKHFQRTNGGSTPGMCYVCWRKCHDGHNARFYKFEDAFFCDCGLPDCRTTCKAK